MPPPGSRMTNNRQQPTRYRPGKAEVAEAESDDEESLEEENEVAEEAAPRAPAPKATSFPSQKKLAVDLSKAGQQRSTAPAPKKPPEDELEGFVTASESSEDDGEGGSSDEDENSSEEEESSDDEPKKPMLRPTFIPKAKRGQQGAAVAAQRSAEDIAAEGERKRKEKADALLQTQLERDAAARAAGRKAWDDDADINPEDEIDDTDGMDAEAERAAWKLRELKRVRRERLTIEEKEKEREEIERRRNLTAKEREAEDKAYIAEQEDEREGKGKMAFMQKYYHKGAFFVGDDAEQDEEVKAALNRDLAGARVADEAGDKSVLPEYMRIRDMTKLGKSGRTKYKDLKSEDTGRWGMESGRRGRGYDGLDERFRPDDAREGGREQTGANAQPVGERRRREDDGHGERDEKRARYD